MRSPANVFAFPFHRVTDNCASLAIAQHFANECMKQMETAELSTNIEVSAGNAVVPLLEGSINNLDRRHKPALEINKYA